MSRLFAAAAVVLGCVTIATGSQITSAGVPREVLLPQAQPEPPAQSPNVEANIASLYQKLQITPAQEAQFNAVANVMRQNARAEASAPQSPPANVSAVESLRAEIQYDEMELAGMKRFLPALEALYAVLWLRTRPRNAGLAGGSHVGETGVITGRKNCAIEVCAVTMPPVCPLRSVDLLSWRHRRHNSAGPEKQGRRAVE
jgi:hypothetical protein